MFQKKIHSKIRVLIIALIWLMIGAPAEAKPFPIHKQIEGFFNQETFHYNYKSLQALYTKSFFLAEKSDAYKKLRDILAEYLIFTDEYKGYKAGTFFVDLEYPGIKEAAIFHSERTYIFHGTSATLSVLKSRELIPSQSQNEFGIYFGGNHFTSQQYMSPKDDNDIGSTLVFAETRNSMKEKFIHDKSFFSVFQTDSREFYGYLRNDKSPYDLTTLSAIIFSDEKSFHDLIDLLLKDKTYESVIPVIKRLSDENKLHFYNPKTVDEMRISKTMTKMKSLFIRHFYELWSISPEDSYSNITTWPNLLHNLDTYIRLNYARHNRRIPYEYHKTDSLSKTEVKAFSDQVDTILTKRGQIHDQEILEQIAEETDKKTPPALDAKENILLKKLRILPSEFFTCLYSEMASTRIGAKFLPLFEQQQFDHPLEYHGMSAFSHDPTFHPHNTVFLSLHDKEQLKQVILTSTIQATNPMSERKSEVELVLSKTFVESLTHGPYGKKESPKYVLPFKGDFFEDGFDYADSSDSEPTAQVQLPQRVKTMVFLHQEAFKEFIDELQQDSKLLRAVQKIDQSKKKPTDATGLYVSNFFPTDEPFLMNLSIEIMKHKEEMLKLVPHLPQLQQTQLQSLFE